MPEQLSLSCAMIGMPVAKLWQLAEILSHEFCDGWALSDGSWLTGRWPLTEGHRIKPGDFIILHFAGAPCHLKPFGWQAGPIYKLVRAEHQETHGAGYKSGTCLIIEDQCGRQETFRDCGIYSPCAPEIEPS